jgi:hypothetical protein
MSKAVINNTAFVEIVETIADIATLLENNEMKQFLYAVATELIEQLSCK